MTEPDTPLVELINSNLISDGPVTDPGTVNNVSANVNNVSTYSFHTKLQV